MCLSGNIMSYNYNINIMQTGFTKLQNTKKLKKNTKKMLWHKIQKLDLETAKKSQV